MAIGFTVRQSPATQPAANASPSSGSGSGWGPLSFLFGNNSDDRRSKVDTGFSQLRDAVTGSTLPDQQRRILDAQMEMALQRLDRNYGDDRGDKYIDEKQSLLNKAYDQFDSARLQALASPQKPAMTAEDRMALQAVIAQSMAPYIDQANKETSLGNQVLSKFGDYGKQMAAIRAQNTAQQNAAFAGSLGPLLQVNSWDQLQAFQRQAANNTLQTLMAQAQQSQGVPSLSGAGAGG
jgi:hypothetical protein